MKERVYRLKIGDTEVVCDRQQMLRLLVDISYIQEHDFGYRVIKDPRGKVKSEMTVAEQRLYDALYGDDR